LPRRLLPLIPAGLLVQQVLPEPNRIVVVTAPKPSNAACPLCGGPSGRVHSRYVRNLADLPWQGRRVVVRVQARRFRCAGPACRRRIFAERLPEVTQPWARRTDRLSSIQRQIGLALGGLPGVRLALRLAMPVSSSTLLRLVGRTPTPTARTPRVLGVDDWAWRRGQSYGTVLVDLERRRVVDLLPDRDAATLAAWLRAHPGVEVVARASAYADGIRSGAPDAVQVADRWHLLRNCSDALQLVLDRNRGQLRDAARAVIARASAEAPPPEPKPASKLERHRQARQADRDARFAEVARLAQAGMGTRAITRATGLARNTVRRWLADGQPPTWRKGERPSIVDPFVPYLHRRLADGCRNATRLWREIQDQGFRGKVVLVRACVARITAGDPACATPRPATPVWRRPSARQATRMLLARAELPDMDARFVAALGEGEVGTGATLARRFAAIVREQDVAALPRWLEDARDGPLAGFAEGLRRDRAAVEAALTLPWSTGPVEGKITKLKLVKRSMYGRASIGLLRQRMLTA
jgi:transposase